MKLLKQKLHLIHKIKKLLNNKENMVKYLKENKLIEMEISYVFENFGEQLGLVTFYIPEELGYRLANIINPEYKPIYRIYIRVAEGEVCFIELEGGPICWGHYKRDEKMLKFEEELKALPLGATFRVLPM
jgi:hypothetical protein